MYAKPCAVAQSVAIRQHLISYTIRAAQRQKSNYRFPVIAFHFKRYSSPRSEANIFNAKLATASEQRDQPYDGMKHGRFNLI